MLATHAQLTRVLRTRGRDRLDALQALVAMEVGYKRMFARAEAGTEAEAEAEVVDMRQKAFRYFQRGAPSALAEENDWSGSAAARAAMDEATRAFVEPRKLDLKLTPQEQAMLDGAAGGSGGGGEEDEEEGNEEEERHDGDEDEDGEDDARTEL